MYFKKRRFTGRFFLVLMLFTVITPLVSAFTYTTGTSNNVNVTINAYGNQTTLFTANEITKDYIKELGINLNDKDYLVESFDSDLNSKVVDVVAVTEQEVYENVTLPSSEITLNTDQLEIGQSRIVKQGKDGLKTNTYYVRYENGKEVSRVLTNENVIDRPVDTIKEIGTAQPKPQNTITVSSGKVLTYSKVIIAKASAYDLSYESTGKRPGSKGYGITASGMKAAYGVVAVDKNVIPLGTKLYIESTDGTWSYGEAIAGDTGGAIKGNRVDLFFNSRAECLQFGRRTAKIYVLE